MFWAQTVVRCRPIPLKAVLPHKWRPLLALSSYWWPQMKCHAILCGVAAPCSNTTFYHRDKHTSISLKNQCAEPEHRESSVPNLTRSSATISFGIPGKPASDITESNASFVASIPAVTVKKTDSNSTANNMAELIFPRMENGPSSDEGYRDECDLNNCKLGMMWKTTKSLLNRTNRPECVIFRIAGSLTL